MGPIGRLKQVRILQPLRERDFALLTGGSAVSLIGDGFFHVALAWQVYQISNVPTAMSFVGVAATLPLVLFILIGGTFSDRYDRRRLMIGADVLRGLAIGAMGVLSMVGVLELWHVAAFMAIVGLGDAFFNPSATAIVPDLLPEELLPQANAVTGVLRRMMLSIVGPALAGFLIAIFGPGQAFVIDALTFVVSAAAVWAIRARPQARPKSDLGVRQTIADIGEGLAYVRARPWIWATLLSAMLSLLVFLGPVQVLVPFLVKNRLNLGPEALGAIFAVGGVGSIIMAIAIGQLGLPRRRVTVMFVAWTVGIGAMAVYGLMTALWQALLVAALSHSLFELGQVIWTTMLQQLVPRNLLGRVSSVDWLVSIGLVPLSYALTGPASEAFGPGPTMVYGALAGAVITILLILVPGVRDPERVAPAAPKEMGLVVSTSPEQDAL
ncbi:MAG TPA: MFS transporter [Candidatus Limnocylindria bacterium]|nr:MFS transporter [Candidatus Limnocylindria bacterium]